MSPRPVRRTFTSTQVSVRQKRWHFMTVLEWIFIVTFTVLYIALVFTVALMTFQKGYVVLGIFGIFVPILWLIGAVLPAKPGSAYEAGIQTRNEAAAVGGVR